MAYKPKIIYGSLVKSENINDAVEELFKGKWKEVSRNGVKFYANGPNAGKRVGSVRGTGAPKQDTPSSKKFSDKFFDEAGIYNGYVWIAPGKNEGSTVYIPEVVDYINKQPRDIKDALTSKLESIKGDKNKIHDMMDKLAVKIVKDRTTIDKPAAKKLDYGVTPNTPFDQLSRGQKANKNKATRILNSLREKMKQQKSRGSTIGVAQTKREIKEVKERLKWVMKMGYKF